MLAGCTSCWFAIGLFSDESNILIVLERSFSFVVSISNDFSVELNGMLSVDVSNFNKLGTRVVPDKFPCPRVLVPGEDAFSVLSDCLPAEK